MLGNLSFFSVSHNVGNGLTSYVNFAPSRIFKVPFTTYVSFVKESMTDTTPTGYGILMILYYAIAEIEATYSDKTHR